MREAEIEADSSWKRMQCYLHSYVIDHAQIIYKVSLFVILFNRNVMPIKEKHVVSYGWPFLSIPRTLTAISNFEVDGLISISSTSKIWCRRVDGFISTTSTSRF